SQFKQVREVYGNQGKTQAYASRISFSPKEFDPTNEDDQQRALDIAKEVYQKTYPNQIQLQSKQQIELTEQLQQIEQTSQHVNQAFQTTLNSLENNNKTNKEQ